MREGRAKRYTGRAGTVEFMPPNKSDDWRSETTMDSWFCDCPGQSPAWRYYVLSGVHLRDVEGQDRPPLKRFRGATHELLLFALNPEHHRTFDPGFMARGDRMHYLRPPNVMMQVECTDEEFGRLLEELAKGIAHGMLPAEPPFPNPHDEPTWKRTIEATLEHIKLGGHPEIEA